MTQLRQFPAISAPLQRFVYRSEAAMEMTPLLLASIVEKSIPRNRVDGITGTLIYGEGEFVQFLEGPGDAVAECYARICEDRRHKALEILYSAPALHRAVPDHPMRLLHEVPGQAGPFTAHAMLLHMFREAA